MGAEYSFFTLVTYVGGYVTALMVAICFGTDGWMPTRDTASTNWHSR
jgi:hypothetical protein